MDSTASFWWDMALYSLTEAENYYQHNALPSDEWANKLTPIAKGIALEMADRRFQSLPWKASYMDADVRKVSAGIEAAFFSYLTQITEKFCPPSMPTPATGPDKGNLLNVLADLPRDVSARLLPFLDASYLTPVTQQSTAQGRRAMPMNVATQQEIAAAQRALAKI